MGHGHRLMGVYPRVRGEYPRAPWRLIPGGGLSPRARGIPASEGRKAVHPGSIPACAGNTQWWGIPHVWPEVYPRVRGEYTTCDVL